MLFIQTKEQLGFLFIRLDSKGRTAIAAAIADYHKYTCLKFQEVSNPSGGYILFRSGTGYVTLTTGFSFHSVTQKR